MQLIDIGVNLTHRSFAPDREAVVDAARQAGVSPLVVTGTSLRQSQAAARLAAASPGLLYATAGVHPHDAKDCDGATLPGLHRLLRQPQVVAVGECGLDYERNYSPQAVQRRWFAAQLDLAAQVGKPLFLHERAAHRDFAAMLRERGEALGPAVVHCFTGSGQELENYLSLGLYIGITGWICDERRGRHLKELVGLIPPGRLMLETDAPFLTPRNLPVRPAGGRNEPRFLPQVLNTVAACLKKEPAQLAAETTATAKAFFRLP